MISSMDPARSTSTPWPAALPARQVRVARPTDRLDLLVAFYRDGLGLPELDRFDGHAGYRGVVLGLPGNGHHLEFTSHVDGSPSPVPTGDTLLALFFDDRRAMAGVADRLTGLGHRVVAAENPYWTDHGAVTVEDPDGWRVVLVPEPFSATAETGPPVDLAWYDGDRTALRPLFELAEDSPAALDGYLDAGRVLVARCGPDIVGHLQLIGSTAAGPAEIQNMAVREDLQGRGIGGRLVHTAVAALAAEGASVLRVATAAADVGNLAFYQRQGFRLHSVERDAFTPATGYPAGRRVAGIPLRDRVWLDLRIGPAPHLVSDQIWTDPNFRR